MHILVLQHVPFEGPALILQWAEANNHDLSILRTYEFKETEHIVFPALNKIDWLIVMGGPMSVNDSLPWITPEVAFISDAIAQNKRVLGICLGAQLIAKAMGAKVKRHSCREIGWFPVSPNYTSLDASHWLPKVLPNTFTPLHWHGDTFDIPHGAQNCFHSAACKNQGFVIGTRILALQFHLELSKETAQRLTEECADELNAKNGDSIQSADDILEADHHFKAAARLLNIVLDAQAAA